MFSNHGCLHCAFLKALYGFKGKKEPTRQVIISFSFKIFKVKFLRFSKCLKTIWNSLGQLVELVLVIMMAIYHKDCPNQRCDYLLITPNQHYLSKLISFNSGQLQISEQLQNNTVNVAKPITINRVINSEISNWDNNTTFMMFLCYHYC